jgi:hypothetical protein
MIFNRCKQWIFYCQCEYLKNLTSDLYSSMYRVCSKHFHDRCFTKGIGQTPRLKRDALPTLNLPERQTTSEIIDHSYSVMSNTPTGNLLLIVIYVSLLIK